MRTRKRPATKPSNIAMRQPEIVDPPMVSVERADFVPAEAQVRALAYEIYRARCDRGEQGDELADWISAEIELKHGGKDGAQATRSAAHAEASDAALVRNKHLEAVS
jgi:hypothetical protein